MQVTKIYCDHCGKELSTMNDYDDCDVNLPDRRVNTDLCSDCAEKLSKLIAEFLNKDV